jgi:Phospholipase_D-nuclease N-terminal
MPRLFVLFFLADLALLIVALIDCLSTDEHEIRALPRVVWAFIIVLFSPIGPIAWFMAGRPQRVTAGASSSSWHPAGSPAASRQRGPDDDPDFLRELAARTRRDDDRLLRQDDEKLLRQWEADLRRREEELRRREASDSRREAPDKDEPRGRKASDKDEPRQRKATDKDEPAES